MKKITEVKAKMKVIWLVLVLLLIGIAIKTAYPVSPYGNFGLYFAVIVAILIMFLDFWAEDAAKEDNNIPLK